MPDGHSEMLVAFCPHYRESHLRAWLDQQPPDAALRVEELCRSRQGRSVELLRAGCLDRERSRGMVLLTSRHHACEAMATYALEGSVFTGGAVIQWLRDELGLLRSSTESEEVALRVPDTGGAYLVPAFTGLGAPHWQPDARGLLTGLTLDSSRDQVPDQTERLLRIPFPAIFS